jgi:predicted transposase YbfD/YdcC
MYRMAEELCDADDVAAETVDVLDNQTTVTRQLVVVPVQRHWAYGKGVQGPMRPDDSTWSHTRTFLRIESVARRGGEVVAREVRHWNSSLGHDVLTPAQWLEALRSHWGVENNNHHTLDTAFAEDDRPWITGDARGTLAVLVLRRMAYTLLTLFRSVSQRSDERRGMPWRQLLSWVRDTLVGVTDDEVAGLRRRGLLAITG